MSPALRVAGGDSEQRRDHPLQLALEVRLNRAQNTFWIPMLKPWSNLPALITPTP